MCVPNVVYIPTAALLMLGNMIGNNVIYIRLLYTQNIGRTYFCGCWIFHYICKYYNV